MRPERIREDRWEVILPLTHPMCDGPLPAPPPPPPPGRKDLQSEPVGTREGRAPEAPPWHGRLRGEPANGASPGDRPLSAELCKNIVQGPFGLTGTTKTYADTIG